MRTSWATPASSLPRAASRSLRLQVGLQAIALGRLAADGACEAGGEGKRERDAAQGQARGQPVSLERSVDKERIDQPRHHPGGPHDAPADDHRSGANRHGDRAVAGKFLNREQRLLLADRRVDLDVDQVGLQRRQTCFASSLVSWVGFLLFVFSLGSRTAVAQQHCAEEALVTQDKISPFDPLIVRKQGSGFRRQRAVQLVA